ncbi:MAG: hypothetical protein QUS08_10245 [Methanothrix sp.]|nr:hypothetical protein [Methanothrix sp.]
MIGRSLPAELHIGGVRIIIMDAHNQILPYWFEEHLKRGRSLVALRIDEHHDMFNGCPSLPATEGRRPADFLVRILKHLPEYSERLVNEGNFTCPAFHYGVLGALYHIDPRRDGVDAYGRVLLSAPVDPPRTKEVPLLLGGRRTRWIVWDEASRRLRSQGCKQSPVPEMISEEELFSDLRGSRLPIVIGFDLDGLYGLSDRGPTDRVILERLERVRRVLQGTPMPAFVCLVRSQRPKAYVPPDRVDDLEEIALGIIESAFG